jgi:hypothetical protein
VRVLHICVIQQVGRLPSYFHCLLQALILFVVLYIVDILAESVLPSLRSHKVEPVYVPVDMAVKRDTSNLRGSRQPGSESKWLSI